MFQTMPSNVEIKARVDDVTKLKSVARELSGTEPTLICQEDVFFNVPAGRLKLRMLQVCGLVFSYNRVRLDYFLKAHTYMLVL